MRETIWLDHVIIAIFVALYITLCVLRRPTIVTGLIFNFTAIFTGPLIWQTAKQTLYKKLCPNE